MKSLFDFISEARETVGKLPFSLDDFKQFLAAVADYDDESAIYKQFEEIVTSTYGKKVWNGFKGWCEGSQYNSEASDLYDILCKLPKNRLERILGAGSFGAAVELSNGMVCKVYHKNTPMEKTERKFFEYCAKHGTEKGCPFPRVIRLGSNFVVMEKLKTDTAKCKMYDKYLGFNGEDVDGKTVEQHAKDYIKNKVQPNLDGDAKECFEWAVSALTHLKKAVGWDAFSDMRLANIGERADGTIVWFDI